MVSTLGFLRRNYGAAVDPYMTLRLRCLPSRRSIPAGTGTLHHPGRRWRHSDSRTLGCSRSRRTREDTLNADIRMYRQMGALTELASRPVASSWALAASLDGVAARFSVALAVHRAVQAVPSLKKKH